MEFGSACLLVQLVLQIACSSITVIQSASTVTASFSLQSSLSLLVFSTRRYVRVRLAVRMNGSEHF